MALTPAPSPEDPEAPQRPGTQLEAGLPERLRPGRALKEAGTAGDDALPAGSRPDPALG